MIHVIPKKTKVKMEIFRGFTLGDIFYLLLCGAVLVLFIYSNIPGRFYIGAIVTTFLLVLSIRNNGIRIYSNIGWFFRFLSFKKKFSKKRKKGYSDLKELIPYTGIVSTEVDGDFINYKEYYGKVIEISPVNYFLLNDSKQDLLVNVFANSLRRIGQGQYASIIKLNKPLILDDYVSNESEKEDSIIESAKLGLFSDEELLARDKIFQSRKMIIDYFNKEGKIYKDYYYMVVYSLDKQLLANTIRGMMQSMRATSSPINSKELKANELVVFLKANYGKDFNEREINKLTPDKYLDWIMPETIKFKATKTEINGTAYSQFVVSDYPLTVTNAWGYPLTTIEDAKVVINFTPLGKMAAERLIDKSIIEMETQMLYASKLSQQIDKQTALQTMKDLLISLKNENEQLFDVNCHIMCEYPMRKEVKAVLKEHNFKYNEMFGRQVDAFISANVSRRDTIAETVRGIQTTALAGFFPFISADLQDKNGIYLGYSNRAVFVNFFKRDNERQNSNMVILGRSGSGKSFATLTLLANFAADESKIFVLDPEYEYKELCNSLGGKIVDVGSGSKARFNPFHVMLNLEDDDDGTSASAFEIHLQFLEEFFRLILEGISVDALETLNTLVVELYKYKGITVKSNFKKLKNKDYPTFDELYDLTSRKLSKINDEYLKTNYKTVLNYITKFASGGRNAGLWNGPSSIETEENFIVFSFQSLLANRNQQIAKAQMLLVFKYLNNEIIKNREFNQKFRSGRSEDKKRKIIVAVDEAHSFINPKYPIALDFMYEMAKRIRKYTGMQIIITQNIRDFMGSEDMIRQSSAIIAASQYSVIFSLAPNDVTELVKLYKNAGEINETEQNNVTVAGLGDCFLISGAMSRTNLHVDTPAEVRMLFDKDYRDSLNKKTSFLEEEKTKNKEFDDETERLLSEQQTEEEYQNYDEQEINNEEEVIIEPDKK